MHTSLTVPRLMFAGVGSGVGRSLLVAGIAAALRTQGVSVSCCSATTAFSISALLGNLTNRTCLSLDARVLSREQVFAAVYQASIGADIVLIDGHEGLFDAQTAGSIRGSDAEIARDIGAPIVLVVDGTRFGTSVAPLLAGYGAAMGHLSNEPLPVRPLLNLVGGNRDELFYDAAMQLFGLPPILGAVTMLGDYASFPTTEFSECGSRTPMSRQSIADLTAAVRAEVDLDALRNYAATASAKPLSIPPFSPGMRRCRVAISSDPCFFMHYQDNINFLKYFGAETVNFSPLADRTLPRGSKAVYFTGGMIQDYGPELSANNWLKDALRTFVEKGGILYSEGAGTAFLADGFTIAGTRHLGAGIIPGEAVLIESATGTEPFVAKAKAANLLGEVGLEIAGVRRNEWRFIAPPRAALIYEFRDARGVPDDEGFAINGQHFSTFGFMHWGSNPSAAEMFVDAAVSARIKD